MEISESHDVVIIGGGLAGLTTAKFLAEAGIDFVLLEEHADYHKKACGEGLGTRIKDFRLNDLYESKQGFERELDEIVIETKYGEASIHAPIIIIDKKRVEGELAKQAIHHGASIRMNQKVNTIKRDGNYFLIQPQNIKAKVVVGADGFYSIVRKTMGIKTPVGGLGVSGICDKIDRDPDRCYLVFNNDLVRKGYIWFFPKQNDWNIGIGSFMNQEFQRNFNRFKSNYTVDKWRGGYGPLSLFIRSKHKKVFLVGDAGSQIRSIVGAGNFIAMVSGKILANTIISQNNDYSKIDSKVYEQRWQKTIGRILQREYYIALIMKQLMNQDRLVHFAITKLSKLASQHFKNQY